MKKCKVIWMPVMWVWERLCSLGLWLTMSYRSSAKRTEAQKRKGMVVAFIFRKYCFVLGEWGSKWMERIPFTIICKCFVPDFRAVHVQTALASFVLSKIYLAVRLNESFSLMLQLIPGSCDSGQGPPRSPRAPKLMTVWQQRAAAVQEWCCAPVIRAGGNPPLLFAEES